MILQGRFSQSEYLVTRLKAALGNGVHIFQPPVNHTTIVSHGVVLARAGFMQERVPQISYGYL